MGEKPAGGWWSRKLWVIVLFPCLAAVLLAGVAVFKGWLHKQVGFDESGRPIVEPEAKGGKPRPPASVVDAYRRIAHDLQRQEVEARPRFRYLSLLHRHNEPTSTDADLETERRAVRELAALLGRGKSANLDFIDPDQLLFRIDLAEFDWTAETDWHRVVSFYRYGLGAVNDSPSAKLQQQVEEFTQDKIPVVRADWFVVALSRPPLAGTKGLVRTSFNDLPEAVRAVSRQYAAQTLDVAACARELGVKDVRALTELIHRQENLQQEFGLAPLLREERIRREWWESDRNFFSPYQELARLLKVGKPVRVQ